MQKVVGALKQREGHLEWLEIEWEGASEVLREIEGVETFMRVREIQRRL